MRVCSDYCCGTRSRPRMCFRLVFRSLSVDSGRGSHDWRAATHANHEVVAVLDKQTRGAILLLRRKGHSLRRISQLLSLSRDSVRKVAKLGSDEPPIIFRPGKLDAHRERIAQMLAEFDGNVVKVHRAL